MPYSLDASALEGDELAVLLLLLMLPTVCFAGVQMPSNLEPSALKGSELAVHRLLLLLLLLLLLIPTVLLCRRADAIQPRTICAESSNLAVH
jgi:hypothetical protein